jgi:hypothetical protein
LLFVLLLSGNVRAFLARGFLLPEEDALVVFRLFPPLDADRFRVEVPVEARLFLAVVDAGRFRLDEVVDIQPSPAADCRDDLALATRLGTRMNKLELLEVKKDCALSAQIK